MMRAFAFAAAMTVAVPAFAQTPPPPPPEMVLLPRATVEAMLYDVQAIARLRPELATPAVEQTFGTLSACLADNPVAGRLTRQGQDQCQAVTDALAAQDKALADAKAAAKPAAPIKP